jgi:hypothetical protein
LKVFELISGICGIIAFVVLCLQGVRLLGTERRILLTRDPARALAMAKRACEKRHLDFTVLAGDAAGIAVTGRAYKVRSVREEGERDNWLSPVQASRRETR